MALKGRIVDLVIAAAEREELPPAALLAVVEVESAGEPLETDGRTPRLLFERHVFHRELAERAPAALKAAKKAGLAIAKWSRSTQYKDQGTSAARLALIARARAIDTECANRACSWGLGQTMGFLAEELGYLDATHMVAQMTDGGIAAQIDMMLAEVNKKGLRDELARGDWAGFARVYNGPGFAENAYDAKMEAAHRRWQRQIAMMVDGTYVRPRHEDLTKFEIEAIQQQLVTLGYPQVGDVDGRWGRLTTGAISAFQMHEGLPVTGDYDDATRDALAVATKPEPSPARAATTAEDLRAAGSQTVAAADRGRLWAKILGFLGLAGGAEKSGALDGAQSVLDQVQQLRPIVTAARDVLAWVGSAWWIVALVAGAAVWHQYGAIVKRRIADRIEGRHV
ncbi:N-acetylmuramidase domain-containing protein [Xanthobacter sp. KR7-225]|uniref:N-acetylmuramidase domain-containing protein n=1 Tax=Xanthobacter sp. KR7-225 TaxID=3156613 RepID=UPI0032B5214F